MRSHRLNIIHQLLHCRRKLPAKIFSFLTFYISLFSFSTFAQENLKYEEKEIYLRIKNTFKRNDSIDVFLDNADSLGIKPGMFIKGWQSYKDEVPGVSQGRELHEIGTGKMVRADSIIAGFIKLYDPDDSLALGDMISIRISIPVLSYRSVFSELAFQNIFFTDFSKKQLYRLQDLVYSDGKKFEDSLYSRILKDFKTTYDYAMGLTNLPKDWLQPLTGTRLTGKTPIEILGTATMNELEAFLLYVTVYPAKYMGTGGFVVSQSIGGWLTSNAPYSYPEVKKALFPIRKNKSLLKARLPIYKYDILNENAVRSLDGEVIDLLDQLKYAEAYELADFALSLAYSANDSANLPFAYLTMAEVYLSEGLYSKSIFQCDKAGETARKVKDIDIEFQAKTKKAYCLFNLSKFSEAESFLAATTKELYEYRPLISKDIFLKNAIKIFEQRYSVSYKVGNYKMAFEFIDSVIAYDKLINSYESVLRNARYYKFKGEVYNAQGQPDNALVALQNALDIYSSNNDVIEEANIENETAKSYFNLNSYDSCIYFARKAAATFLRKENYSEAAYSYSWMGQSYWSLGAFDPAIKAHDTAILYSALAKDTARLAWSWQHIGELYQLSGEKTTALNKFKKAEFFYSAKKDSLGLAAVYNDQGVVYLNDENYKTAKTLFENAKKVSIPNIEVLFNLGQAWRNIDTVKSRKYFEDCHKQSLSDSNTFYQFQSSNSLARLAYSNKNMSKGRQYYQECNALSKLSKKLVDSAYCLSLKGYEFGELTQLDSALKYYKDAEMAFSLSNKVAEVYCLNDIANIFISTGEFSMADSIYRAAIKLAHSIHDQLGLGYTLSSSTFLYGATGQFQKGLSNSDSAFSIFIRSGNNVRLAGAYFTKATLLSSMGNFKGAIQSNLIADSIYKHELITDQRSIIYNNIGVVYRSQEDYVNALKNFDLAIKLLKKGVVDESYLLIQGNRAECLHYLKRSKEAETLLLQVLPQATKLNLNRISSGMAVTLGDVYLAQKKFEEAKNSYTNALNYALASGEKEKIIETLTGLGRINNQTKKIEDAEKNFRQAVSVVEEMNGGTGWDCYYELGLIYFTRSKFDSAATYFSKAIEFVEKNMKNLFGGDDAKKIFNNDPRKADLYNKITFTFFKLGDFNSAWEYANRYNLTGLKAFAGNINLNTPDKEKNEALQQLSAIQNELKMMQETADMQQGAARQQTLQKKSFKEKEYKNLINDLTDKYNDLAVYFKDVRAQDLKTYKEDIPEDMAVLIYMQHENTLMVISLTHDSLAMDTIAVNPKKLVQTFIESAKSGLLSMRQGTVEDAIKASMDLSDKLYRMLIDPLSNSVKSKKKYCIVPTGFYSNLPFQCLGNYGTDNEFHYVIEGHSIFYVIDVSIFRKNQEGNIRNDFSSFAAFGVPDSKLHYNLTEVANVGKIVGYDSTLYVDDRATKNKAIESLLQKKIIHFSTHGVLSFEKYSLSYLKLMPDKDNDGRLTMGEVDSLTIPPGCDMVVLSACETAVNKTLAKGWNISPANAFLESNVRTVVASLWKVDDEATRILMENFYTNLKSMKNVDKAEALRLAQLELMKNSKFAHPNYWGAFAMYGDWR